MSKEYKPDELIYAKKSWCPCGALLAYTKEKTDDCWDCSAILEGKADKNVTHTAKLPFVFWKVK